MRLYVGDRTDFPDPFAFDPNGSIGEVGSGLYIEDLGCFQHGGAGRLGRNGFGLAEGQRRQNG